MIYGYARVSTATQGRDGNSLEEQEAALRAHGCQEIVALAIELILPKYQYDSHLYAAGYVLYTYS